MAILSALKYEASRLQKQLDTVRAAIRVLGETTASVAARAAFVSNRESENSEGAKGAVGQSKGREEERLTTLLSSRFDQAHPMHAWNL